MSDMTTPEDPQLDGQLVAYYQDLGESAVPVKLHGRIVATLESRGRGFGLRSRRPRLSRFAPAAVVVLAVAAVALAALPWTQHAILSGPNPSDLGTTSSAGAAGSPNELTVTVMNLDIGLATVALTGHSTNIVETLRCGESRTFRVTDSSPDFSISDVSGARQSGPIGPYQLPAHVWLVHQATGSFEYDTQPDASSLFAICPSDVSGTDPSGRVDWDIHPPVASGFAAASGMNAAIGAAVEESLGRARDYALARPGGKFYIYSLFYIYSGVPEKPRMISIELAFTVTGDTVYTFGRDVNIDMSDGHAMTIEELFSSPSAAMAVLSSESKQQLSAADLKSARTTPVADSFSNWMARNDGLQIYLKADDPSSPETYLVVIPWSAIQGLLKPSSPIWDYVAVH